MPPTYQRAAHWISIHALREEGDAEPEGVCVNDQSISIHALREEGDSSAPRPYSSS